MSYDSSTGIISAPVSIDDVRSCLGESSYDLGTLCKSDKINIWAKYKPIALRGDFINLTNTLWWRGSGNCGLFPKCVNTLKELIAAQDGNMNGWTYSKPLGNEYTPYRLLDFVGYYHNAQKPFSTLLVPKEKKWTEGTSEKVTITVSPSPPHDYSLSYLNFDCFYNNYFTIYCVKGSQSFAVSADNTVSAGGNSVEIPLNTFGSTGEVTLYQCFATKPWSVGVVGGSMYTVPKTSPTIMTLVGSYFTISWSNEKDYVRIPMKEQDIDITIKNDTTDQYIITKIIVIASFKTTFTEAAKDTDGETKQWSGSYTLKVDASLTKTFQLKAGCKLTTTTMAGGTVTYSVGPTIFVRVDTSPGGDFYYQKSIPPVIFSTPYST